jgi:hypothetical protein
MTMETPLITSEAVQAERLTKIDHILNVLLRPMMSKMNIIPQHWQDGVIENGGEFQDLVATAIKKLVKKASGIVTPRRAEDTGLIPDRWKVYVTKEEVRKDKLEGDVDLAKVDYVCPLRDDGDFIKSETMLQRAAELKAIGSLGYAAELLKAQEEGKEIFPVGSRGKHYFIMPLTELLDDDRRREVACFHWDDESRRWVLRFRWADDLFFRSGRFVVPREEKPSVT